MVKGCLGTVGVVMVATVTKKGEMRRNETNLFRSYHLTNVLPSPPLPLLVLSLPLPLGTQHSRQAPAPGRSLHFNNDTLRDSDRWRHGPEETRRKARCSTEGHYPILMAISHPGIGQRDAAA